MNMLNLLNKLKNLKINIQYVGDNLKIYAPKGKLSDDLINEIKENKGKLIKLLQKRNKRDTYASIEPVEKKEYYKLSSAQKRLYIIRQMGVEPTGYNLSGEIYLDKDVDKDRLEITFREIIERHEIFRTSFEMLNEEPVQKIHDNVDFEIEYYLAGSNEYSEYEQGARRKENKPVGTILKVKNLIVKEHAGSPLGVEKIIENFVRPFDLSKAPLLRVGLINTPIQENNILLLDMHHIISDGSSLEVLRQEFNIIYNGDELPSMRLQYKDYSGWQNSKEQQETVKKQEDYWLNKFSGELPVLNLPVDFKRPTIQSFEGSSISFFLKKHETFVLKDICLKNDATLFMMLLSIINILLFRISGQEDIIVGTPTAGRRHAEVQNIIGMFVNTLVLKNYLGGEKSFVSFLGEVKEETLSAFKNQDYQFEDIVEKLALRRDISRNPIFDIMFNLPNMAEYKGDLPKYTTGIIYGEPGVCLFDMVITAVEADEKLFLSIAYCRKLFKASTIERLIGYLKTIVSSIAEYPGTALSDIDFITEAEKQQVLYEFNDTGTGSPETKTVVQLFEEQVRKTPNNNAIGFEDSLLTYKELNKKSNQLGRLLRKKGVKGDTIVGLVLARSLEMVTGIMGILKAGGAYLPVEPGYPEERIGYMFEDSGVEIVLTTRNSRPSFPLEPILPDKIKSLFIDGEGIYKGDTGNPGKINNASYLAYIIYTSGSTGKPKGVMVEHRNLAAYLYAFAEEFQLVETDVVIQQTSYSFDASVEELYPILLKGGRLVIPVKDTVLDINLLVEFIAAHSVTMITCSPLMLKQLNSRKGIESIRIFISGGDVLKGNYITNLVKREIVYNTYGPTESTVCAAYYKCGDEVASRVPVGKPIVSYKVYILDKNSRLVPRGVVGELCIDGPGVTRGYLGRIELTREKFTANPHAPGERIYRSGDLARWLTDGNIEFLGRIDQQVKVRGFRIEVGEIENRLIMYDSISETVVIDREDKDGEKYLTAYLVLKESCGDRINISEFREFLSKSLPGYMIPSYFVQVEKIPVTPNGKVNRKLLPPPAIGLRPMTFIDAKMLKSVRILPKKKRTAEDIFESDDVRDIELTGEENKKILYQFNSTEAPYPQDKTIHQLFEEQVEKTPDNVALIGQIPNSQTICITYQELNEKSNQLARILREKGLEPDSIVGIMVERSLEMIVGILGILKAGGAYMPIDQAFPQDRRNYLIEESNSVAVLVNKKLTAAEHSELVIDLDDNTLFSGESRNLSVASGPGDLAQVLYTSGTTGNPKGVAIEHRSVINLMTSVSILADFRESDNVLAVTPITFDLFAVETLLPLTRGSKVVIGSLDDLLSSKATASLIESEQITIYQATPSALQTLMSGSETASSIKGLRYLLACGEIFPDSLGEKIRSITGAVIYNFYGPTETTMYSTVKDITQPEKITIGKPISNTGIYILGKNGRVLPIGVPGEICIGGIGVARGYLNRQPLTREQFIENPFVKGNIIYKTGDLGKWLPNGEIEFIGRIDHQVKISGIRMELGEIESLLLNHKDIRKAVVVVKTNQEAKDYICAYLVSGKPLVEPEIRRYLSGKLPHYMIPSLFVQLEEMPLTPNRKTDRRLLESLEVKIGTRGYTAPISDLEMRLTGIWADLLNINGINALHASIGIDDNFFELGGHSLKAVVLTSKIHKELEVNVPLTEIFKTPTIRGLAEYIKNSEQDKYTAIKPAEKKEYYELSSAQKRLYILQQMDLKNTSYNMCGIISLNKDVDIGKLEKTFNELIKRHDSFRTSFEIVNEEPVQKIHDNVDFAIEYHKAWKEAEKIIENLVHPFDLSKAPLVKVGLISTPESNILLVDMHHIISDGVSHQVLEEEFNKIYNGDDLPILTLQYIDYAQWQNSKEQQHKIKDQEEYWLEQFSDELPVLNLPTDYTRPAVQSFEGNCVNFVLSENETKKIKYIVKETGTTLYMVILSIYNILLSKLSGQEDIIIGTPIATRRHSDLERIIGMFVNTLAIRNFPSSTKTFKQFLKEIKEQTLDDYENQDYPFEEMVDKLALRRDTSRNPVFDVVFNLVEFEDPKRELAEVSSPGNYKYKQRATKFDLILRASESGEQVVFNFEYCVKLFKQETIERIIGYFKQIANYITANPDIKISDIEIIDEDTRKEKLNYFNRDLKETGGMAPIQVKIYDSFHKYKQNIAIEYGDTRVTYSQLERRAAYITQRILDNKIEKGSFMGIYLDDKIEIISTIIGILNAGCVFVPLDTKLPIKLIENMIQTVNIQIIFTDVRNKNTLSDIRENIPDIKNIFILGNSSYNFSELSGFEHKIQEIQYNNEDIVYIYFTSGTTGIPHAIAGKNESLVQFIQWEIETFSVDETSRVSQLAAVGFDAFLRNVFTPLCAGGTICIPGTSDLVMDSDGLVDWIDKSRIGLIHCVPSVFRLINSTALTNRRFSHLKYVLLSGEQVNPSELKKWYNVFGNRIQLVNCYGATETTVIKTFHFIQKSDIEKSRIPVGRPMRGALAIVLDRNKKLCPQGIMGEIYIRSPYRSIGYLDKPELNAQQFLKNPFSTDKTDIIYKTGDLGRELENRDIEILGRIDRQVKIRGVRIELGNIENCLLKHNKIDQSVVISRTDGNSEDYLCAYIVNKKEQKVINKKSFTTLQNLEPGKAKLHISSPRRNFFHLNHLPLPDRSLVNYEKYTRFIGQSLVKNSITLLGSRGCPYACAYCHKIWPKKQVCRSAEKIFEELQLYYNIGFRRFVFLDDIFNLNVKNTVRFFQLIIENKLDVQLCLNLRGDILTQEYIDLMVKAGVIRVAVALETASPRLQKMIGKNLDLKRFKKNMEYFCKAHPQIILEINTMHGFPSETEEEAKTTLDFIKNLKWIHFAYINILKIYPNTGMERLALEHGISKKAINDSAALAYHELPDTLPFDKYFTLKYQLEFMSEYFLLKERLLHVLPYQLKVLTEDEIIQKYNSYLPVEINSFEQLLKFTNISKEELNLGALIDENRFETPGLNKKLKGIFPATFPSKNALKILLLDLSQFFSCDSGNILYDVVEAPLGLMYLMSYLKKRYDEKINGKIAKSRIDFDNFAQLKRLLTEFKPGIIGIRTLTYFKDFFHKTIEMIRQWGIEVPIVAGGPYATSDFTTMLQDKNIDLAVLGEGEETLSQLVRAIIENNGKLPAKKDLEKIQGIAFVSERGEPGSRLANKNIVSDALEVNSEADEGPNNQENFAQIPSILNQPGAGDFLTTSQLREHLLDELPEYMIPSHFTVLEKVPLTPNGKIDWRALPEPKTEIERKYMIPVDETEEKLIEIWSEVLDVNKKAIGRNSNFFELGGHSLKATILTSKIHKKLNVKVPLAEIFKTQTIMGLLGYIKACKKDKFTAIDLVEKREYYELSSAQKRLFILQQMNLESTGYNMFDTIYLDKEFDKDRLGKIFRELIKRHETFRTSFEIVDEEPVQLIQGNVKFEVEYYESECSNTPHASIIKNFVLPFDLSKAPLFRVGLITTQENNILLVDMHHIISDGTSLEILREEFRAIYDGKELPGLRLQYKDYAEWQNNSEQQEKIKGQGKYWLKELSDELPVLTLPIDYKRPAVQSFEGNSLSFVLSKNETEKIKNIAKETDTTLYMVLLSIYNILLSKLSGKEDIIIGTPIAARRHEDLQRIIGMFVNTLAIRNYPKGDKTFKQFLNEVKMRTLEVFENQEYQFEDLVDKLSIERDTSRNPIFDAVFALLNQAEYLGESLDHNEKEEHIHKKKIAKFDLILHAVEIENGLRFFFEYCAKLFKAETIERFSRYFNKIVTSILKSTEQEICEIEIIMESEKRLLLDEFNDTSTEYPRDKTIHELYEEQVERTPDHIALVGAGLGKNERIIESVSYKELNRKSNQLANRLVEKGVKPNTIVGIMVERSIEMIIGVLGIMKAGGGYLPIDPDYPQERKKYMLADSDSKLLLTEKKYIEQMKGAAEILPLEHINQYPDHRDNPDNLVSPNQPDCLIYVIYTSGSTGRPKGVIVEHRNVVRLVKNTNYIEFKENDRLLQTGALDFDASTFEIWGSVLNGLTLYITPIDQILVPEILKEMIKKYEIHTLWLTSPLFNQLTREDAEIFAGLRNLLVGGDVLSPVHINKVRKRFPGLNIINGYGPTENTTFSTTFLIEQEYREHIPIGSPIANSFAYIVDKSYYLLPPGVAGELWVGGSGVSRGYLNNPGLTAEKFINMGRHRGLPLPLTLTTSANTIFKTGDLARWLPDGNIAFLGRIDHQVKIRGFRIELEEIESQLKEYDVVREAVVVAKKDKNGEKYLCAYINITVSDECSVSELRRYLSQQLPDYMIPSYFVKLDNIPLTSGGKTDRRALPEPDVTVGLEAYTAPRNEIEEKLVEIWSDVLGIGKEKISIDDNFFLMGGHSLKATIVMAKIHKELKVKLPLVELFRTPNIRHLSEYIRGEETVGYFSIEPVEKKEYYALSSAQKRLYILQQMEADNTSYNLPVVVVLEGELNREKIEEVFTQLISRHESLRTSFEMVEEEPVQKIYDKVTFEIEQHTPLLGHRQFSQEGIIRNFIRPFDLSRVPQIRVGLIKMEEAKHLLMVDMHHIITDGTSQEIFTQELMALYENKGEKLLQLRFQYKDFAQWQNSDTQREATKKQEECWRQQFEGEIPILHLPTDYLRPAVQSFEGRTIVFEIKEKEAAGLNQLALAQGTSLYMVLLALYTVFLAKITGQEDIVVGTPVAGRKHADLQQLIGMFVNTLGIRNYPEGEKTFTGFLQEVKKRTLEAFENQDYPFEDLVEKVAVKRDIGRNPLFDVMFALQNIDRIDIEIPGLKLKPYNYENKTSKFDLTLYAVEIENELRFIFEYCTKLFRAETIERFSHYFSKIVTSILQGTEQKICEIDIIPESEKRLLLEEFNATQTGYPEGKTINELFEEQVGREPGAMALVFKDKQLTYRTLNEKAGKLAQALKEKGVHTHSIVALAVHRSLEMLVGILGILKAGAAYLPVDPGFPLERIRYMLEDSCVEILLTQEELAGTTAINSFKARSLDIFDREWWDWDNNKCEKSAYANSPAYLIYTSGSTGKPKGVMIEHRNVINFIEGLRSKIKFLPGKTVLALTTIAFDIFVLETLLPLLTGLKVIAADEDQRKDPELLGEVIVKNCVNMVQVTPSTLTLLLSGEADLNSLRGVTELMVGGEPFTDHLFKKVKERFYGRIYNLYGPTETTVWSALRDLTGDDTVHIGSPIANTRIYIINRYNQLQPVGVVGELCIAGAGIARGYLNNPELTVEKFDQDFQDYQDKKEKKKGIDKNPSTSLPLYLSTSLYHTGDLARWLPDGNIEFRGRIDNQVKIRGFRIELGEIEDQLLKHKGIKEAVVTAKEDAHGNKILCAYIISCPAGPGSAHWPDSLNDAELREFLSGELPHYMIPSHIVQLEKVPLTPNGKIDRKALPDPEIKTDDKYTPPRSETERKLVELWSEVLASDEKNIGIDTNFFELGGHSLLATILVSKIHKAFNVKLLLMEIFKTSTIRGLSEKLNAAEEKHFVSIKPAEEKEYYPSSSAQKRLYILQQMNLESKAYNISQIMIMEGELERDKFEETCRQLVERHEGFSTSFEMVGDKPVQRVHKKATFSILYFESNEEESEKIIKHFKQPFDLSRAPLLRIGLIKVGESRHILMADMHHIISDAVSVILLIKEFTALYGGEKLSLPRLRYKDFSAWQNSEPEKEKLKKQEEYWLKQLGGEIPLLNLPTDYTRPAIKSIEGNVMSFEIGQKEKNALKKIALDEKTTLFMVLLTVYSIFLSKVSGQEEIVIGTPTAGRGHAELENIIGIFINTLALRNYPEGKKTFREFLNEVREGTLQAFENQDYQFDDLVEKIGWKRDASRNPLFDVVLNFMNHETQFEEILQAGASSLKVRQYEYERKISTHDLILYPVAAGEKLSFSLEYCTKLFKEETIKRFIKYFKEIVSTVVINNEIKLEDINISHNLLASRLEVLQEDLEDFAF